MDDHEQQHEQPLDPVAELNRKIQESFKQLGIKPKQPNDEDMPD
ncbi:hypothetical protein [Paenibacillus sp. EPM92]|nr:hypothetical protein [Paenibacillus sp. EPM92]